MLGCTDTLSALFDSIKLELTYNTGRENAHTRTAAHTLTHICNALLDFKNYAKLFVTQESQN